MKKIFKKPAFLLLCVIMTISVLSMGVQAASIKLNKTKATMTVKGSIALKVTGTTKKVTWSSSNTKVATVTSSGTVNALKAGKATITAKVGTKKLTCKLTVNNNYGKLYKNFLKNDKNSKWYYVKDIDLNGIPDLVTTSGGSPTMQYTVYTIKNGKVAKAGSCSTRMGSMTQPILYYKTTYKGIYTSGWSNYVGGSWGNLYTLSGKKVKHIYHAREEHSPKDVYYTGTTDTNCKKVSKSSYQKFCKKYFTGYKKYNMLKNNASNRNKSFG